MTRALLVIALFTLAWTATASAQTSRPERPYRGLFRGGEGASNPERRLSLNVLVGGGYDDNVLADTGGSVGGAATISQLRGMFGRVGADLGYGLDKERVTFGASVATDSRYFPELDNKYYGSHSGSVGVSGLLGRRTRLTVNQTVSYQPFLTLDLFPTFSDGLVGVAQPASQDQSAPFEDYTNYLTSIDLRHSVSRRGVLEFGYGHEFSNFTNDSSDLRVHRANGRYTHEVARGLGVKMGYAYSEGEYFDADEPRTVPGHVLDVGIDYSRALSFSRHTTLSFSTGSTALRDADATRYGVIGDVRLNREIGRSWNTSMAYSRQASFVRTFNQPFFADAVAAEIGGLVNRRVQLAFNGSAAFGAVGINAGANSGYESYAATSLLTVALTRNLAITASYDYYKHNFESGVVMPDGLASDAERQSAQIVLRMWVPLYQSRSSNASR